MILDGPLVDTAFGRHVLENLRARKVELTRRWLDELRARLPLDPRRIFPDETLLNHIPELLDRLLAGAFGAPEDGFVDRELSMLANLRRAQGYDVSEVLAEYELLRVILLEEVHAEAAAYRAPVPATESVALTLAIAAALGRVASITAERFLEGEESGRRGRAELLTAFGRSVAHELRNRIHASTLTLRVLEELDPRAEAADFRSFLRDLARSLERLHGVVHDVYTVTVAQEQYAVAPSGMQPLDELVQSVAADLRGIGIHRAVEVRVAGELPTFPVDATRVQLALMNLGTNAVKYSDPDKVVRWVELRVSRHGPPRTWRFDVQDNGVGIRPELQASVFSQYLRASDEEEGEGIGLFLSKEAIEQLGGEIWLHSEPGIGSTFSLTLREPSERFEG